MKDSVRKYKEKRKKRLDSRFGEEPKSVELFKKRRDYRLKERGYNLDAKWEEEKHPRDEGGKFTSGSGSHGGAAKEETEKRTAKKETTKKESGSFSEGGYIPASKTYGKVSPEGYVDGWKPPKVKDMDEATVNKVLSGCSKIGGQHYDRGTAVAREGQNSHLWTYTSHGLDHVQQVVEKTNQAADAIERLPQNSVFHGATIDRPTMLVASWFHDTGMDGDDVDWSNKGDGGKPDDGNQLRKAHAINSAIHVLENAEQIKKLGVDPNKVAMTVFAHTKSMSGVEDLSNPKHWRAGLDKLESAINEHERETGQKVKFDRDSVFGGEPSEDNIRDIMATVAAIRLGDANREAQGPLRSQSGGEYKIEKMPKGNFEDADEEAKNSVISITEDGERYELSFDDDKMKHNKGHPYSKKVVLGERNLAKIDTAYNEKHQTLQEEVTLADGRAVPYCTVEALLERCGELNTINGIPRAIKIKMSGVKDWNDLGPHLQKAYRDMWTRLSTETTKDKKTGEEKLKYGGVKNLVLEFENGEKRASAHDFRRVKNQNMTGGSAK